MLTEIYSKQYLRDLRRMIKRGKRLQKLFDVINLLKTGEPLPPQYRDHPLNGEWEGYRDCHIEPDWILIYKIDLGQLILALTRTGSHSDLRF
ncbi:MAG: type II toxin-antitoxin system YafQ family toxin [Selenomonadaceae bacterium]|nr:type II toxin-antitoxin system YafQ family toxin [Selenomonadaceae bacterium]